MESCEFWDEDITPTTPESTVRNSFSSGNYPPARNDSSKFWSAPASHESNTSNWRNAPRSESSSMAAGVDDILRVEGKYIPRIIGRGGSNIKDIEQRSGAQVKILNKNKDAEEVDIKIIGPSESQKTAKEIILECISGFDKRGYSNRDDQGFSRASRGRNDGQSFSRRNRGRNDDELCSSSIGYADDQDFSRGNNGRNDNFSRDYSGNADSQYSSNTSSTGQTGSSFYNRPVPVIDWDAIKLRSEQERAARLAALPPIKKDFYFENKEVLNFTPEEVEYIRETNNSISVFKLDENDERKILNPVTEFYHAFEHYPELMEGIENQGFVKPSPIQSQAWPIILKGYDFIGIAQTGTGKTIAFLFPAFIHITHQKVFEENPRRPSCIVMAPTRELAQQIESEARKYPYRNIKTVCVYGGGDRREQINILRKGAHIIIATPGRLNDVIAANVVDITRVSYLVLDEADRMLDLGFEPQIRKIMIDVRPDRQMVMTSATWTNEVESLATRYMTQPMKVNVGSLDLAAVHTVDQEILFAYDDDERREILMSMIESMSPDDKLLVFVDRKAVVDDISSDLVLGGIICQSLHGDREQIDREQALDDFKSGEVRILIATDVASRGLDVKDVTHVFNMYFPRNIEEYVHRIGRTGRAGQTGHSVTIFSGKDSRHAQGLIKILEESGQVIPDFLYNEASKHERRMAQKSREDRCYRPRRY